MQSASGVGGAITGPEGFGGLETGAGRGDGGSVMSVISAGGDGV
jgi:hypothetical protein